MKFIFPQNYDFKNKLLGIIDYSTVFVNVVWCAFIFLVVNFIIKNITIKVFIFITFTFPLILLSFVGFNGENIIYVLSYLVRFIVKPKLYLYRKN